MADWQAATKRTVQSDRWFGKGPLLAGSKLIAAYPVLGWWDRRHADQVHAVHPEIVTIVAPGIYTAVQAELAAVVPIEV